MFIHFDLFQLKLIRQLETHLNKNSEDNILSQIYRQIEHYVHTFPCGCGELTTFNEENYGVIGVVHPTLIEILKASKLTLRTNSLDEKRQKKILHNLESLKGWITSDIQFDEINRLELIQQLMKIPRALQQLAVDVNRFFINDVYKFSFRFNHHYRMYFSG